jgi:hypothetical protein
MNYQVPADKVVNKITGNTTLLAQDGGGLHQWVKRQRTLLSRGVLSPERALRLERCVLPQSHLTRCINQMVFESQLPHKIVKLLFTISLLYNKMTIFCVS